LLALRPLAAHEAAECSKTTHPTVIQRA